jgi:uncharacterized protein
MIGGRLAARSGAMHDDDGALGDDELDELDAFLASEATPPECMDISMLDGFLTALAVGPSPLPPELWMPVIWGGEMRWSSQAQARRITGLIFRHANALLFYLRDEPDEFEPLLFENEVDGKRVPIVDEWCSGFVQGMALDEEGWQPFLDSEEGEELLYPILLYGTEAGWQELQNDPRMQERNAELVASLGDVVLAVQAHWLPQRKAASTLRRDGDKTGRNDLCPCGSGKKYKKCCGAPGRLH